MIKNKVRSFVPNIANHFNTTYHAGKNNRDRHLCTGKSN